MKMVFLYIAVTLALTFGAAIAGAALRGNHDNTCAAPCVVKFGPNMAEDQFRIDYRGDGTLRVWKQHVDDVAVSTDVRGNVTLVQGLSHGKPVATLFDAERDSDG